MNPLTRRFGWNQLVSGGVFLRKNKSGQVSDIVSEVDNCPHFHLVPPSKESLNLRRVAKDHFNLDSKADLERFVHLFLAERSLAEVGFSAARRE